MEQYIKAGKVTSTRGLNGEVNVESWCNTLEDFRKFKFFFMNDQFDTLLKFKVEKSKAHKNHIILKLEDINSKEKASKIIGKILYVARENIALKKNEYLLTDLIGLKVINEKCETTCYGIVTDVITRNTKTLIYEITNKEGKKHLIPAIEDFIKEIDIKGKKIKINPIPGLLDNAY